VGMSKNLFTKDTVTGVFSVVLGVAYLISTSNIPKMDAGDQIGPRAFPYLVSALVIGCGLWLLVKEFFNPERKPFSFAFIAGRAVWLRILLTIVAGIVYGLVLDWLGYLIATFFFMIIVCTMINVGKHRQNLIIATVFSIFTFVAFALVLNLSLPRGLLGAVLPF
ncbi:MAG: tripartite tricarboxylate transporter TctB family protein, partial [Propionivibrio sp.]